MEISGAELWRQQYPDLYRERLQGPANEDIVASIRIDLPRTFPDNINYRSTAELVSSGKVQLKGSQPQQLFNVLVAYAHDNEEVGYCQVRKTYIANNVY
jgi:vancomycin resistance protein YoaR